MKNLKFTIENYRNIPLGMPVTFEVKEGISFILGMNNVGKSTILKFFFELREVLRKVANGFGNAEHALTFGGVFFDQLVNRKNASSAIKFQIQYGNCVTRVLIKPARQELHTSEVRVSVRVEILDQERNDAEELRQNVEALTKLLYFGPFRSIDVKVAGKAGDIDIGKDFIDLWNSWAAGENVDHIHKTDLLVEELKELFGFKKFNIRVSEAKNTLLITTDDGTFRLDELGSGIAQFIIVLGNALIKKPSYILIDEPETGLHPRLQEVFVRALASKASHGLIASSHSIGLARSTADAQILSLTRLPEGHFQLSPFGEHYEPTISQSVHELGYSQFIEIGGNNILLVEGRTDIKCYREILRKYGIETSFIIMSLGGSDFIGSSAERITEELNELNRLNAKSISVIFDSERINDETRYDPKFEGFITTCRNLNFQIFPTDGHSTENYLTQESINSVEKAGRFTVLGKYENFSDRPQKWSKNKNWLMFREMNSEDFEQYEIHSFIREKLVPHATSIR